LFTDKFGLARCGIALRVVSLHWLFSSGVGVNFAQSFSQWEARADTKRNVPNPADQLEARKPGLSKLFAL
jgi:hypothetical protein